MQLPFILQPATSVILTMADAQAMILVIGSIVTGLLSVITAIVAGISMVRAGKIHTLVNSALDKEKLKITMLETILLAKQMEIDTAEKARIALAASQSSLTNPVPVVIVPPQVTEESRIIDPGNTP